MVKGVECQFGHVTISQWESDISTILEGANFQSPLVKAMSGTLVGIPLYGETLIHHWKVKVANYPDVLAQRMIEHYLKFFAGWGMQERLIRMETTALDTQGLISSRLER